MRITSYRVVLAISTIILGVVLITLYKPKYSAKEPTKLFNFPHYIPRRKAQEEEVRNGVPLIIYESWISHEVPKEMRDNILQLLETNPEFDYYLFSHEDCAAFIADNYDEDVLAAFHALKPGAFKSDLWRYCILYKLGGVYLDIKYYSTVPLISIIDENQTIFVRDVDSYLYQAISGDFSFKKCFNNAFMVSPPRNEIFKLCIDDIVKSYKQRSYNRNILDVTGPCMLGRIIEQEYTAEYYKNSKFTYTSSFIHGQTISYGDTVILKQYKSYRNDQAIASKNPHYSILYLKHDIYN